MLPAVTDYTTMFSAVAPEAALAVAAGVTIGVGIWILSFGPTKALNILRKIAGR